MAPQEQEVKRIAIVGSGVSGLSALWTLRNSGHEVHLFEKDGRLGGHTNTATWKHKGHSTPVDTGFIVLNTATYPNFIAFLENIGVKTMPSEMTFGISRDNGLFEWSGTSPATLFAQPTNALKPSFWRMIFDIIRFNMFSLDLLTQTPPSGSHPDSSEISIGEYLQKNGYSDAFRDDYLIPMTACVWSTGPDKCALEFPARTLIRFMWNHHLLSTVAERPPWLTIGGGSKQYIDAVIKECPNAKISMNTAIESVSRKGGKVILRVSGNTEGREPIHEFDEVIMACHGDQAYRILGASATSEEKQILSAFETTPNIAYLHSDLALMPLRRTAWSAWNYLTTSESPFNPTTGSLQTVTLTYNMNILQKLPVPTFGHVLVTLNPEEPPASSLTQGIYQYRHPLYNSRMVAAQEELGKIQGNGGIWYAGAWTNYGFHEDGFASGMRAGLKLGGSVPWEIKDAKFSRGTAPVLEWKDHLVRIVVVFLQLWVTTLEKLAGVQRGKDLSKSSGQANGNAKSNGKAKTL
ncbi:amine oxidase [Amniculicola lignicola CBS 123094]|uniref:Amine oxidase n=1 Tax=Amniculicola lignicola CBS 123094 TaxID=1392246 RepID=A0A6A5WTX8_9PLEO|nr:amine oxidase [Amniculicola lignicola CBS 123094]